MQKQLFFYSFRLVPLRKFVLSNTFHFTQVSQPHACELRISSLYHYTFFLYTLSRLKPRIIVVIIIVQFTSTTRNWRDFLLVTSLARRVDSSPVCTGLASIWEKYVSFFLARIRIDLHDNNKITSRIIIMIFTWSACSWSDFLCTDIGSNSATLQTRRVKSASSFLGEIKFEYPICILTHFVNFLEC